MRQGQTESPWARPEQQQPEKPQSAGAQLRIQRPGCENPGTPAHIAEKYLTLSRDAQSSGDPVLAENYLQHAEHYTRIIMAYRDQLQQPGDMPNGNGQRLRDPGDGRQFGDDDGGDDMLDEGFAPQHQPPAAAASAPRHSAATTPTATSAATIGLSGATSAAYRGGDRIVDDRDRPMEGRPRCTTVLRPRTVSPDPVEAGGGRVDAIGSQQPHGQPVSCAVRFDGRTAKTRPATPPPCQEDPSRD